MGEFASSFGWGKGRQPLDNLGNLARQLRIILMAVLADEWRVASHTDVDAPAVEENDVALGPDVRWVLIAHVPKLKFPQILRYFEQ